MSWILIAVLAILALFGFIGWKKGILRIALSVASIVVTVIATVFLVPLTSKLIKDNTKLYQNLYEQVYTVINNDENISGALNQTLDDTQEIDQSKNSTQLEQYVMDVMNMLDFPESIKNQVTKAIAQSDLNEIFSGESVTAKEAVIKVVAYKLTDVIFNAILYIVVFVVILVILRIIFAVTGIFSKLPVIKELNKTGGLIFGLLEGLFVVWILFIVITANASQGWASSALADIGSNGFLEFLYNNNLILKIVFKG